MTSPHPGSPAVGPGITPATGPALDPEPLAALVEACPAVAGLHGGRFGEVATYLPGRRVRGVRVVDDGVEIHVVGRYPATVAEIAAQVRAALTAQIGDGVVHVVIEDLATPGDPAPADAVVHDRPAPGRQPRPTHDAADTSRPRPGKPAFPPPSSRPAPAAAEAPAHRLQTKEPTR